MATDNTVGFLSLGTFKTGEIPQDLAVRYDDHDGAQINISSGYTGVAFWRERNGAPVDSQTQTVSIQTGANPLGLAVVLFDAAPFAAAGSYFLEVWVGTTANDEKTRVCHLHLLRPRPRSAHRPHVPDPMTPAR